jgi:hypothetical protein
MKTRRSSSEAGRFPFEIQPFDKGMSSVAELIVPQFRKSRSAGRVPYRSKSCRVTARFKASHKA